jgi:glycosyltransferase involved in cell wall biosynthesis
VSVASSRRPRVFVVAYDFPPHAAIGTMRTLRVVQRLAEDDWDVTVLTSDPATFRSGTPVDAALLDRIPPQVRVVRAKSHRFVEKLKGTMRPNADPSALGHAQDHSRQSTRQASRGLLHRVIDTIDAALAIPDHESAWLAAAITRGLACCRRERPDVIYSSAPPWTGQLVAAAVRAHVGCPWIADFRDPWARAPWREDRPLFARRAAAWLERQVITRADGILFVTDGNRRDFEQFYGSPTSDRFHVIPNGCDPTEFAGLRPEPRGGMFVLLHAGSLYGGRNPLPLLRAIANAVRRGAINRDRFRLRLIGQASVPGINLETACRELGLEQIVEPVARVPRRQSLQEMLSASALLLIQPGTTVSVPGKLYEYFATGRPILAMTAEGETAALVRASGNGVAVPPDDERRIEAALVEMIGGEPRPPVVVDPAAYDGRIGATRTVALLRGIAVSTAATGLAATIAPSKSSFQ